MRFVEIIGNLLMPLSNEEAEVVDKVSSSDRGMINRSELSLRERELARKLVSRGALNRVRNEEAIFYLSNLVNNSGENNE